MLYLVTKEPKGQKRMIYWSAVRVVEADNAKQAIETAQRVDPASFSDENPSFAKTKARPLDVQATYLF